MFCNVAVRDKTDDYAAILAEPIINHSTCLFYLGIDSRVKPSTFKIPVRRLYSYGTNLRTSINKPSNAGVLTR